MRETNIDKPLDNIIIIIIVQIFIHIFLLKPNIYSIMKKFSLLLQFSIISICSFSQEVRPFNLKNFQGKKILSLFKSTTELRGSYESSPSVTNQYHTISRSISFKGKEDKILVDKTISNLKIKIENIVTFEGEEFDTDKKFDRSSMASMVYGKYDEFVNKPFTTIYTQQNKCIDTLRDFNENNFYFNTAWSDGMLPYLQEDFLGLFQMSSPQNEWKVGQIWQQVLTRKSGMVTKNENILNTYTVKSIIENEITIEIKGVNIPEQVMIKRVDGYVNNTLKDDKKVNSNDKIKYTIEQKSDYQGLIKVDLRNNFISKLEITNSFVRKIYEKDRPVSGPESTYMITIENTLEDLK